MRAYSNMPCHEFLDTLRDSAVKANAAPAIIDAIDSLHNVDVLESELEEANGKLSDMERDRDDLREALEGLLNALPDLVDALEDISPDLAIETGLPIPATLKTLNAAIQEGKQSLERTNKPA